VFDISEKHRLEMELQEAKAGLQDLVDELLSTEDELASKKILVITTKLYHKY
jgi:hypothetical protein